MEQIPGDSPLPGIDAVKHNKVAAKSLRGYARKLFAEVAVRIVAFAADLVLVLFVMLFLDANLFQVIDLNSELRTAIWILTLIVYFAASWVGPLRATPMQFLFRMQVIHESGETLTLRDAVIRSVALVALWGIAVFFLRQFFDAGWWLAVIAVPLLLYVPSITARRQGLHDFLAHSVVVNKRAIRSGDDERHMRDYLADRELACSRSARPSIYKMVMDAIALAIPLFVMTTAMQVTHQKNMYGRVAYAMQGTEETRQQAEARFRETGSWPRTDAELGQPLRQDYPAGGYFQLEEDGAIRIQFEVLDELKNGSILMEPVIENGEVTWRCRSFGDIHRSYLPARCR